MVGTEAAEGVVNGRVEGVGGAAVGVTAVGVSVGSGKLGMDVGATSAVELAAA